MHIRRKIREAVLAKLLTDIGGVVDDRVFAGRLSAVDTSWELPAIMIDVARSQAAVIDPQTGALQRPFEVTVTPMVVGPDTDTADLDESYADKLDELAVLIEWSLSRSEVLYDKLGIRMIDWRFVDDIGSGKGPAKPGHIASLTLRYHAVLVHADGKPIV